MCILIVDYRLRVRQGLKALLEAWYPGEEVHEAVNEHDAIRRVVEFLPDIILIDVYAAKGNGLETIQHLKAVWRVVKIIALSMNTELQPAALAAGADAFVSKSDPPEKLGEAITKVLREMKKES
jgi:DNA-binding NarL/FixJ family response regulator